jgi:DNA-binding MarR family transcriptional regulator
MSAEVVLWKVERPAVCFDTRPKCSEPPVIPKSTEMIDAKIKLVRRPRERSAKTPPLTISRPEMLVDGSDREFRRLVHGLFGFFARHEAVRSGHAARIGLVGIEYTVLISIRHLSAEEGDVNVSRLANHLHLSAAFVTKVTNKLLKSGLIHKTVDPADRRRVKLEVSSKGDDLLAELAPAQRQVNDVQFGCLSANDFRQLLKMTERLIESGDQAIRLQNYMAGQVGTETRPAKLLRQSQGSNGSTRSSHRRRP